MNIVIDANVLFSALIKDSLTRRLILEYDSQFLFPEYIFTEFEKHKDELLHKMRMTPNEAETLLQIILRKVVIIPNAHLKAFRDKALAIAEPIDVNDVIFIACALAYPNSILWSNDKKLKQQHEVTVLNTQEMKHYLQA